MTKRRITAIVNHWSDTNKHSTVEDIRQIHLNKGWRDIGYHRVILHPESDQFRTPPKTWSDLVKLGRELDDDLYLEDQEVGAHCYGHNTNSVGICTIGMPGQPLHSLQREAIINTNKIFLVRYKLKMSALVGHRDFYATQCPGNEIYNVLQQIKKGVL